MQRALAVASATGAVAATVAGAMTAHAAPLTTGSAGPCPNGTQHIGPRHHSFSHSHDNCVTFADPSDTAFLTDSNFNEIVMNGLHDTVHDFRNSGSNTVVFEAGATNDTVSASHANNNFLEFQNRAVNDLVTLLGSNNTIRINGINDSVIVPATLTGADCTVSIDNLPTGTVIAPGVNCL